MAQGSRVFKIFNGSVQLWSLWSKHRRTERSSLSEIFPSLFTSHFAKALLKYETWNPRPKWTPLLHDLFRSSFFFIKFICLSDKVSENSSGTPDSCRFGERCARAARRCGHGPPSTELPAALPVHHRSRLPAALRPEDEQHIAAPT